MLVIKIKAGEWFDRTYGNSYYSVKIWVGDKLHTIAMQYGYGDSYLSHAAQEIIKIMKLPRAYQNTPIWKLEEKLKKNRKIILVNCGIQTGMKQRDVKNFNY